MASATEKLTSTQLEEKITRCLPNLSDNDKKTLISYLRQHPILAVNEAEVCEQIRAGLRKALEIRAGSIFFVLGIVITVILNIFGLVIWYLITYEDNVAKVPALSNTVN